MGPHRKISLTRMQLMLGVVALSGGLAGGGALNRDIGAAPAQVPCHYCGIVEQVTIVDTLPPRYGVSTIASSSDQAIVMLLSALNGASATTSRPKIYEVSVRMDDGSVRALRVGRLPGWKPGDRVKIIRDRVQSLS